MRFEKYSCLKNIHLIGTTENNDIVLTASIIENSLVNVLVIKQIFVL